MLLTTVSILGGTFQSSSLWWRVIVVAIVVILGFGQYYVGGLQHRLEADLRLACEISFGDALLVFDQRDVVKEYRDQSLAQARILGESVGKPKTNPVEFGAIFKQFHGPETRSKEEFLLSVQNWLDKFSDFISRWVGWKSNLVIPQGNCIEITNRIEAAITNLQVELRVSPPIIVWRASDFSDDEPSPPISPDLYGQRSLMYGFNEGFDYLKLIPIGQIRSKLETEVTQTDSETVIKFYVDAIRGEQTVVLNPIWVAVTDDRALIKVRWSMTSLNLKGVVKGETDWSLQLVQ